ncbi:MAG TPA: VIT family protein [Acidimicrobiales bacterium]
MSTRLPDFTDVTEAHLGSVSSRLNWLRAGVLGANDGIVSTAALVIGVAAATTSSSAIATAGVAAVVAGAVSMALGEYVSVSTQRDTENALIAQERREQETMPEAERRELVELLEQRGLSPATAQTVADELTAKDPLDAHLELELGLRRQDIANPWAAALSSATSFTAGALLPLMAVITTPVSARIPVAFSGALAALAATGALSAHLGGSPKGRAMIRVVVGGTLAMSVTYGVGELLGVAVT